MSPKSKQLDARWQDVPTYIRALSFTEDAGPSARGRWSAVSHNVPAQLESGRPKSLALAHRSRTPWHEEARRLYESGVSCKAIGRQLGKRGEYVESLPSAYGWTRRPVACARCGSEVQPRRVRARQSVYCAECRVSGAADAHRSRERWRSGVSRDQRRTYKEQVRRSAGAKRRDEYVAEQRAIGAAARKANRDARRAADPRVQLGHFRANGEAPSTVSGARLILKDTLLALLLQRCEDQGLRRASVQYSAKYKTNAYFRANEKAKTAGQKKKRGVLVSPDGSLTSQVVRRLFATTSTCPYCQKLMVAREKQLDHLTPVSRGGTHTLGNVTVCCKSCNSRKRNKPFAAWLATLPADIADRFSESIAA